jgi:hypothetical protein
METETKSRSEQNIPSARTRCRKTLAWADQADPTAMARPSTRVPARAVASRSGKGEHPLRRNFPRKSFSTKMTFVHFDCVDNRILMMSKGDLERQGRPIQETPTPPRYGYLTRHLPRKVTHARISDFATDEQVLNARNKRKETWLYTQMFRPQQPQRTNTRTWGNNGT